MATRVKIAGMKPRLEEVRKASRDARATVTHLEAKESKIMNEIKKSKLEVARTDVEKRFVKF